MDDEKKFTSHGTTHDTRHGTRQEISEVPYETK